MGCYRSWLSLKRRNEVQRASLIPRWRSLHSSSPFATMGGQGHGMEGDAAGRFSERFHFSWTPTAAAAIIVTLSLLRVRRLTDGRR